MGVGEEGRKRRGSRWLNASHPMVSRYDGHAAWLVLSQRPDATPVTTPNATPARTPAADSGHDPGRDPGRKHKEERRSPITRKHDPGTRCFCEIAWHAHESDREHAREHAPRAPTARPDHGPVPEPGPSAIPAPA